MQNVGEGQPAKKFQFVGGELCLDFCNTVGGKRGVIAKEKLDTYGDFVSWCEQAGLVDGGQARVLMGKAGRGGGEAAKVLGRAIALREAIYRMLMAVVERKEPEANDLGQLNGELARSLGRLRVGTGGDGFEWQWEEGDGPLDQPLGPIARSAADLLTSGERLFHVGQCTGDTCGWLFIDGSKNHSRRWCDMRDCGNRAKVRRFRMKQQPTGRRRTEA